MHYVQKVSMILIEDISKDKLSFENLPNSIVFLKGQKRRAVDFEEQLRHTANITVDIVSIHLYEEQSRNENNKKDNHQENTDNKNKANEIADEKMRKQRENTSKQTETHSKCFTSSIYHYCPLLLGNTLTTSPKSSTSHFCTNLHTAGVNFLITVSP